MNSPEMKLILLIASLGVACIAGPIYTLADLGTLGGSTAMATGVNDQGQAAGTMFDPAGYMHAFSSSSSLSSAANEAEAAGINNAGQVAGTQFVNQAAYATVWSNGVPTTLSGAGSFALAINNSGDVAGMLVNNGQGNAFVTQNGTVIDLGSFDGGSWSSAYALNDQGQAAGYGMSSNGDFRGFIWTPGQGYTALGTLGGFNSYAMAINNSGQVAGSSQISSGYSHAFLTSGPTMTDLGTLGGVASYAYGVNDSGNVVGYSWTAGNANTDGFIYEGGVMLDINSLLINAPGWQITALYGINSSNQVVGVGVLDGVEHAVLLTDPPAASSESSSSATPEPAAWIFTLGGLTILFLGDRFLRSRSAAHATRSAPPLPPLPQGRPPVPPR
jgi:probable HAF family extracellular repeat protein